jgi:hypothetical protein
MYWKIRKVSPDQIVRQYGVHVALMISVFVNLILFTTRPATPKVAPELKLTFEQFAKQVTQHLLDTSYITYRESTQSLSDELANNVKQLLMSQDMLAKSTEELIATERSLRESRQVSAIRIQDIIDSDLTNEGMLPVEVRGQVAIHSAGEGGPTGPVPFDFKFLIGGKASPDGRPTLMADGKTPQPIIVRFWDMSQKPAQ